MSNKSPFAQRLWPLSLVLALLLLGCPSYSTPELLDRHYVTVFGHRAVLQPGTTIELPVMVRTTRDHRPVPGAQVTVLVGQSADSTQQLFSGTSDNSGMVTARFTVPNVNDPRQFLVIASQHANGAAAFSHEVTIGATASVLVTTDKPVYQPGQTLHARVLALNSLSLRPAQGQAVRLDIQNPDGITLADQELALSEWGIASLDFALDAQAATGNYIVSAALGPAAVQRTVEVKPYRLPRFEIDLATDQSYYPVEDTISGHIEAAYFFGKPVSGGQVRVEGVTGRRRRPVLTLDGVTDEAGVFAFSSPVPEYYVDRLDQGSEDLDLTITITDTAQHAETISDAVLISADPLHIEAIPESGFLRPGLDNIVYVQVSEPDGAPLQADLTVEYETAPPQPLIVRASPVPTSTAPLPTQPLPIKHTETASTDANGLATIRIKPTHITDLPLTITAQAGERRLVRTVDVGTVGSRTAVLLRPDRAEYRVGDAVQLQVFATGDVQTAYLDVVKERQTVDFRRLDLRKGQASAQIPLDGSLLGTLEINVYGIARGGELAHDRRLVLVNPAPAQIAVQADAATYRPGDTARLSLDISLDGRPVAGALGVSIVDESVFALGGQEPGFIHTYFLLQEELLERRYGIEGFAPFDGDAPLRPEFEGIQISADRALMGAMAQALAEAEREAVAAAASPPAAEPWQLAARVWLARGFLALPVLGLALAGNRRRSRWLWVALAVLGVAGFLVASCGAPSPAAPAAEAPPPPAPPLSSGVSAPLVEVSTAPRLRQFFPETLFWLPELVTNPNGHAEIAVPIADSITTWRVSVMASTREGTLGSAETSLRVFQDFFIEPEMPSRLTANDQIEIPVAIYNYLDRPQQVQLAVNPGGWFTVANGQPAQAIDLAANEVAVARVPIQVLQAGEHTLTFTAQGEAMSDAVARPVVVTPDGRRRVRTSAGVLARSVEEIIPLPLDVLTGTERITVDLYPGPVSQIEVDLDKSLDWGDCPSSDLNLAQRLALVIGYLKESGRLTPEQQLRGERALQLAVQRLLRYRDPVAGGFTDECYWIFRQPAEVAGTARALVTMHALAQVTYVDPALMEAAALYVAERQQPDGTWSEEDYLHETWSMPNAFERTVMVAWSLSEAGMANSQTTQRALAYVRDHRDEIAGSSRQEYLLNALLLADPDDPLAQELIEALLKQAPARNGQRLWDTYWLDDTALIALGLLRAGGYGDEAQEALAAVTANRAARGHDLGDNGETYLVQALTELVTRQVSGEDGEISLSLNQQPVTTFEIPADGGHLARQAVLTRANAPLQSGENQLEIRVSGGQGISYRIATLYYQPWRTHKQEEPAAQLTLDVMYADQPVQLGGTLPVTATVASNLPEASGPVIVELGIPAGFYPVAEDWEQMAAEDRVQDYAIESNDKITAYLRNLEPGAQLTLSYRLWARVPGSVRVPPSRIYQSVAPAAGTEAGSGQLLVTQ